MEFPPSCRTQLFCKLQTHFYSLAFHRLCLSWKHQGASPESVWQHPPPHIIFCRQRGGAGRRGGCVFMLLDETNSLMPGIYQVCRGESLNISVRRRWNVTRSILWSTGMKYNSVVLLLQYFHFFLRLSTSVPGKCLTFCSTAFILKPFVTLQIACCVRANTAPFLIHFFYCQWNHQKRKAHNNGANNQKNAECQIWCS